MYQVQKRRRQCCPHGHLLQQRKTSTKLDAYLQAFPSNVKIHVPSSLICSRCDSNIYADNQPTVATCDYCNFHLCYSCAADSSPSPTSTASRRVEEERDYNRRRKSRWADHSLVF
mmetsp:Transcript_18418/g.22549  ORF Transcript_18418/g.22549 Transcript_18418/m.22549 type:complete len:115 (-) Transcript_18418:319-663(-)